MTTGSRTRQSTGPRRPSGGMGRRRRGRNVLKAEEIDYKDVQLMRRFVSERGRLVSGQRVGVTAKNQRRLARAIKRAQHLALIPMAPNHIYVTGSVQTDAAAATADESAEQSGETEERTETPQAVVSQTDAETSESAEEVKPEETTAEETEQADSASDAESDD